MPDTTNRELVIPALRAYIGDWIYYIATLKMVEIAERVQLAEVLQPSRSLNELIQRQLRSRAQQIRDYLVTQGQRFFNALVIGVYEGTPRWYELAIERSPRLDPEDLPKHLRGTLGMLVLDGGEKLFAIDGQHRVVGIKQAINRNPKLGDEEVAALFVAHGTDKKGVERTRRLFTTLNRYAKPVSKKDIIALDEDDFAAIVTRKVAYSHELFREKISLAESRNIPVSDRRSFTTIVALYDALDLLLGPSRDRDKYKRLRPSEEEISTFYERAAMFWDSMTAHFKELREVAEKGGQVAGKYRRRNGGHLLFRPVGLLLGVRVIRELLGGPIESIRRTRGIVRLLSKAPMELGHDPWVGLLWDATNRRMITAPENRRAGMRMLFYGLGGDLKQLRTRPDALRRELAGLLNRPVGEVRLSRYV